MPVARQSPIAIKDRERQKEFEAAESSPGGENQIVMFKSCFPNSNLEGSPTDPPVQGESLAVSNAKAIYSELLTYFATRPDKLFVVITSPPVQDPTYAANARAFSAWLVRDWLADYEGHNVAVFDFYNVLTSSDNHHRFHNGAIEYVTDRGRDTLHYASNGDDHPSSAGNRKATEEFLPLLNVYTHRWQSGASVAPPSVPTEPAVQPQPVATSADETGAGQPTEEPGGERGRPGLCPGSTAIGWVALVGVSWLRKRTSSSNEQS